jgi:hypothetical protein
MCPLVSDANVGAKNFSPLQNVRAHAPEGHDHAAQGLDKVHAFLFADNEAGRAFWERRGWTWRRGIEVISCLIQTPGR